jgi:hypothetical protein
MQNFNELASWAQIISLPIAVIPVLVSVWLYLRDRQKKALACVFDPMLSPIEIKDDSMPGGDLEIRYKGQVITSLFLVRATLKNVGNTPIRKSEVLQPLTFSLQSGTSFVRPPQVLQLNAENLVVEVSPAKEEEGLSDEVSIVFDLLNPGEEFTAELMCTGEVQVPYASIRVEGIPGVQSVLAKTSPPGLGLGYIAVGFYLLSVLVMLAPLPLDQADALSIAQLLLVVSVTMFVTILMSRRL